MNKELVNTIWQQLGGAQFGVLVGVKNLAGSETGLSFKFGRNSSKSTYVQIDLNGKDLYDITFGHTRKFDYIIDKVYNDIYGDQLQNIFEEYTGLYTTLHPRGQ